MDHWRGASSQPAARAGAPGSRGRGRGRGRGVARGRGGGFRGGSNLIWRAAPAGPPAAEEGEAERDEEEQDGQEDVTEEDGEDGGVESEQDVGSGVDNGEQENEQDDEDDAPSPPTTMFSAFGSSRSAFSSAPFTGSAFGSAARAPAASSAFAPANTAFSASTATLSPFGATTSVSAAPVTAVKAAPPVSASSTKIAETQPTMGISTLPVLGEDSDARKRRFESTLPDNRYLELKPLREAQRARAIKDGIIPDPSKPMRLDQATDFEGTCTEMCPEWEREEREYQNNVDILERYPGTTRIDPARAVKAFHRPAAGNDQPLPNDVRPPAILKSTLDYLFHTLMPTKPLGDTHPFIRDRTRSIRQDFTVQNVRGQSAIECNERIARFHVLALGTLREQSGFSESQELEQLRKVLKSLNEFYDDARIAQPPIPCPNEAEFRSYNLLTHLRDPDIIWSIELLPLDVFEDHRLQLALSLHRLAQKSNIARGERAAPNAASRFFKLVSRPEVPYLFGCILSTHFPDIRKNALEAMKNAYLHQHSLFPARTLAKILGCDDEAEVVAICTALGIATKKAENGRVVVELHKAAVMKQGTIKPKVSRRLVEAKRGSTPYQQVIDGASYQPGVVEAMPPTPSTSYAPIFPTPRRKSSTGPAPAFSTAPTVRPTPLVSASTFGAPFAAAAPILPKPAWPPVAPSSPFSSAPQPAPPHESIAPALNPVAPVFTPARALPARTQAASQPVQAVPNFFASSIPTTAEASRVTPSQQLPLPQTAAAPPRPPLTASPKALSPALEPTRQQPPSPKPPSSPPKSDRRPLITSLSSTLTAKLLQEVAATASRRAAELGLKQRWQDLTQQQARTRESLARRLAAQVMNEFVTLQSARMAFEIARRDRNLARWTFSSWNERTEMQKDARIREEDRQRRLKAVTAEIGLGPSWAVEDEIVEYEEDEVGDGDHMSIPLSSGLEISSMDSGVVDDKRIAGRLKRAETARRQIWTPSTFLDILCERVDSAFTNMSSPRRPRFDILVFSSSRKESFAKWLACKFGLEGSDMRHASAKTRHVDIHLLMPNDGLFVPERDLHTAGAIFFDCTTDLSNNIMNGSRTRLASLVRDVDSKSAYRPRLVVIACPPQALSPVAETELQERIVRELELAALPLVSSAVILVKLDSAEEQFAAATENFVNIARFEDRVERSLQDLVTPLVGMLQSSLRQILPTVAEKDVPRLLNAYIDALNHIVRSLDSHCLATFPSLPPLNDVNTVRSRLRAYMSQDALSDLPDISAFEHALLQRPVPSDASLARLVFDILATSIRAESGLHRVSQSTLDARLIQLSASLRVTLDDIMLSTSTAAKDASTSLHADVDANACVDAVPPPPPSLSSSSSIARPDLLKKKKRKASSGPSTAESSSPKKQSVGGEPKLDRLSALELLMKDASRLLAR